MVDQQGLMLEPLLPTIAADLPLNPLAQLASKRGLLQGWGAVAAAAALYGLRCHFEVVQRGMVRCGVGVPVDVRGGPSVDALRPLGYFSG